MHSGSGQARQSVQVLSAGDTVQPAGRAGGRPAGLSDGAGVCCPPEPWPVTALWSFVALPAAAASVSPLGYYSCNAIRILLIKYITFSIRMYLSALYLSPSARYTSSTTIMAVWYRHNLPETLVMDYTFIDNSYVQESDSFVL